MTHQPLQTRERIVRLGAIELSNRHPLVLIAGPCAVEGEQITLGIAHALAKLAADLGIPSIFKASFDKANRSSVASYRGPGLAEGLRILGEVRREVGVPVLTDVHEVGQVKEVADVVGVLQTPALLVRQTDLLRVVAQADKPIKLQEGAVPGALGDVRRSREVRRRGQPRVLCERGTTFGYESLVADMRGLAVMRRLGAPVIFDATHSVRWTGPPGPGPSLQRTLVPPLTRAAVAVGVAGVFIETHPSPDHALSDGPYMWPLARMREQLAPLMRLDQIAKESPYLEDLAWPSSRPT